MLCIVGALTCATCTCAGWWRAVAAGVFCSHFFVVVVSFCGNPVYARAVAAAASSFACAVVGAAAAFIVRLAFSTTCRRAIAAPCLLGAVAPSMLPNKTRARVLVVMDGVQVRLQDGQMVETVIIAHGGTHPRTTLCVSSQARQRSGHCCINSVHPVSTVVHTVLYVPLHDALWFVLCFNFADGARGGLTLPSPA